MRLIRPAFVIRIAITLILTFGVLAMSSSPSFSYPGFAKDNHGHGKNGKSEKSGKKDKQKGKHQDNGKHKGKNKKEKKAKKVKAEPLAAYTVHVDCVYDARATRRPARSMPITRPGRRRSISSTCRLMRSAPRLSAATRDMSTRIQIPARPGIDQPTPRASSRLSSLAA